MLCELGHLFLGLPQPTTSRAVQIAAHKALHFATFSPELTRKRAILKRSSKAMSDLIYLALSSLQPSI